MNTEFFLFHILKTIQPEHRKNNRILGIDTEHVLDARLTRLNAWAGDLRPIKLKCAPTLIARGDTHRIADRMRIVKQSDHILVIPETRVRVLMYGLCNDIYILIR